MTARDSKYLVAYADCGCVRAIRLHRVVQRWDAEFLRDYPHAVRSTEWPFPVKCRTHGGPEVGER